MPRIHSLASIAGVLAVMLAVLAPADASAHHPCEAVRVLADSLSGSLDEAVRSSPTVRALIEELAASDIIVHVVGAPLRETVWLAGSTRLVEAAGGRRYLRIAIDERLPRTMRPAVLAHELQHAVEVAREPWAVDQRSIERLYLRIGFRSLGCPRGACYETAEAQRIQAVVAADLRRRPANAAMTQPAPFECFSTAHTDPAPPLWATRGRPTARARERRD